ATRRRAPGSGCPPSAPRLPTTWKPSTVHYRQDDQFVSDDMEVDRVRKSRNQRGTGFAVDAGISERAPDDARQDPVNRCSERSSKPWPLVFIPTSGVEQFRLGLWPKDKAWLHAPPVSLRRTSSQGMA